MLKKQINTAQLKMQLLQITVNGEIPKDFRPANPKEKAEGPPIVPAGFDRFGVAFIKRESEGVYLIRLKKMFRRPVVAFIQMLSQGASGYILDTGVNYVKVGIKEGKDQKNANFYLFIYGTDSVADI